MCQCCAAELNENCHLTDSDFEEKVLIDVPMPMSYVSFSFINELEKLEPFWQWQCQAAVCAEKCPFCEW